MRQGPIAIAGASGFVGRALVRRLSGTRKVMALSRTARMNQGSVQWRRCDLFSMLECEQALEGARVAYYLVHSMETSARLTQGDFRDMDLILADNFARAAQKVGVEKIIYLGGIVPPDTTLSAHLASRLEVEEALAAHGVPVTTLRAAMVVGPGGPSFRILGRLVERLPAMLCPSWTKTLAQPIDLEDLLTLLVGVANQRDSFLGHWDVGGPDVHSYRDLIRLTAQALGRKPVMFSIPFFSPGLSRLWVSLVTGSPRALVGPLVESLRHPMIADGLKLQETLNVTGSDYLTSARKAATGHPPALPPRTEEPTPTANTVRSVQRLPNPAGFTADEVSKAYLAWLPKALSPFISVTTDTDRNCAFYIGGLPWPLLRLRYAPDRSTTDRVLLYVTGGMLAQTGSHRGRLEFREVLGGEAVLAAIHDFVPRLPWFIYVMTQAIVHLWVMKAFGRHLGRQPRVKHKP